MTYKEKVEKLKKCNFKLYHFLKSKKALKAVFDGDFCFGKNVSLVEAFCWSSRKEGATFWHNLYLEYEKFDFEI